MLLVSTGFKSLLLGPQSFAQIFNGGEIRVFAGARQASTNHAQGSLLLGTIRRLHPSDTSLYFVLADSYAIKEPSDKWRFLAAQPGIAAWFRLAAAGDTGGDSNTAPRIDGDVGTTAAPNDLTLTTATFAANDWLPIDSFLYTIPPLG